MPSTSTSPALSTCLVGLGTIARTHIGVITGRPDLRWVSAVDPGEGVAAGDLVPPGVTRHADLDGALADQPDLVVVATPTPTHVALVDRLLTETEAVVLSEKPLASTRADVDRLRDRHGPDVLGGRLRVAHHFAFSPEVLWAAAQVAAHPEWGAPTRVESFFNDQYAGLPQHQLDGYVSSWIDSGPNQLSLLSRFLTDVEVVDHAESDGGRRAATRLRHAGGSALLTSNWLASGTSKQTTICYDHAGVRLRMDHTSMTGHVSDDRALLEHAAYTGRADRKTAHYLGVYDALLSDDSLPAGRGRPDAALGVEVAATVARLLEDAGDAVAAAPAWTSVGCL